ncbi:MAG: hydrogenase expression/formation protein HypE [Acidobacteriota bacterium]
MTDTNDILLGSCPAPIRRREQIVLGHGSGGKLTAELVEQMFLPAFRNEVLARMEDQAVLTIGGARLAFTTDAFVVTPIFFPGGDIGKLAVHGTVNDLAMSGARPLYLAASFILEEGLPMEDLARVVESMRVAASESGVQLVAGDTKVVDRGKADRLFITTTGIGVLDDDVHISASAARPGDAILLSGTVGDHGMAVLSQREGLEFESAIESDTAPLHGLVAAMLDVSKEIHCMRDPTRGGLATTLNELAGQSNVGMVIEETSIAVTEGVQGACEILGLDPLYVANEGKLVAIVAAEAAEAVVRAMHAHPLGAQARIIGRVVSEHPRMVLMNTRIGGTRVVDVLFGEQLPRIC